MAALRVKDLIVQLLDCPMDCHVFIVAELQILNKTGVVKSIRSQCEEFCFDDESGDQV